VLHSYHVHCALREGTPDRYVGHRQWHLASIPRQMAAVQHLFIFARFCVKHGVSAATLDTNRGVRLPQR
jgi:hypothetical protein